MVFSKDKNSERAQPANVAGTHLKRLAVVLACSVAFDASLALAQDQGTALAPIVIQADGEADNGYIARNSTAGTKTNTPLVKTPQSVAVVNRKQIEAQGARGVGEALRYTAGVVPEWRGISGSNFGTTLGSVLVRGYGVDGYWDGLKVPAIGSYGAPSPDLYLMERIEVLKGPSSVLFGQATPGGIVNSISKLPTEETAREVRTSIDTNGRYTGGFDFGGPLDAEGEWLYRLTGIGVGGDTQVDFGKEGRVAIAPALTWKPDGDTTLTVLGSYQHDPEFGYYDTVPVKGSAFANPLGKVPRGFSSGEPDFDAFDRTYASAGYRFEHRFGDDLTVRSNLRYVHGTFDWSAVQFAALGPDDRTVYRYALRNQSEGWGLSTDNQVEALFDTGAFSHKALLGIDYTYSDAGNRMWTGSAPPIDLFNPVYGGVALLPADPQRNTDQRTQQLGFYAQDQMEFGNLVGLFGIRHDIAKGTTTDQNTGLVSRMSDQATTGRAGLVYLTDFGLAPYVSVSQSFQPTSGTDYFGSAFEPRKGLQYEVGLKYQPVDFDGLFTLAAFDITEKNRTTPDLLHTCAALGGAPGCGNYSVQLGEVRTRGIEAEAKVAITPELSFIAAYTYLDAKITESNSGDAGMRLTNSPQHMASAWLDYTFTDGALEGLGLGAGIRYVGASPANTLTTANYFEAPAYTLVDAALRYDFGAKNPSLQGLALQVNVKNLFDRDYVTSCGGGSVQAGYCFTGQRRTVAASLAYRW
ncbi:TonB-dependent siderophore receptor [Shinella zoogloeoides]|uniref:TonB-dependent siderophore receptor n=1 Tax=Shinella zoogloeoides TaxID=352475 RepID=UPI0028AAEA1C|nr:TonB-dependent siderophore receptor [Shinella zoogloeoides]